MLGALLARFFLGGLLVSLFSVVGGLFKPKTFAGIFGAAPSVALATLILASAKKGPRYLAAEGEAMLLGGVAFIIYSFILFLVVRRFHLPAWLEAGLAWSAWLAVAFGLWALCRTA